MSTVLKTYNWSKVSKANKRQRVRSYPWGEWFDGRIHLLKATKDFDVSPNSMERVIRTAANRQGVKLRIRIDNGNVVIQTHEDGAELPEVTRSPILESTNGDAPAKAARTVKRPAAKVVKRPSAAGAKQATPRRRIRRATTV